MSGRKASEVNQLLRNGERARSGAMDMIESSYSNVLNLETGMVNAIEKAKDRLDDLKLDMSAARSEFGDAAKKIEASLSELHEQISSLSKLDDTQKLKTDYSELMKEYIEVDRQAEKVRDDLRRKINSQTYSDAWYCDKEYNEANKVSQSYAVLKKRANDLNNMLCTNAKQSNQIAARASVLEKQADRIASEAKLLEEKAQQAKLRENAGKAKYSVMADVNRIDKAIAEKFLPDKYRKITEKANEFCALSDSEIINKFSSVTSEIKEFSTELEKKYSEFLKRHNEINALLESFGQRLGTAVFSEPDADFKPGEHKKMTLVDFLKKYCAGKYMNEIFGAFEKATKLFKSENFDEAEVELSSLSITVDTASEYAVAQHERQKVQLENALAITKTMQRMNYDIDSRTNRNQDGTIIGYDIICIAGDEEIVFENVSVDDNGNFGFGINHKESSSGSCKDTWHDIRNALARNDIFIEDITKNGVSIHMANSKAGSVENVSTRLRN